MKSACIQSACILCQPQLFDGRLRVMPRLVPCQRHRSIVQLLPVLLAMGIRVRVREP
jgi:hypothetical protein